MRDPQIFLSSSGALVRFAGEESLILRGEAKIGGAVPLGPLMRRLSMLASPQKLVSKYFYGACICKLAARHTRLIYFGGLSLKISLILSLATGSAGSLYDGDSCVASSS